MNNGIHRPGRPAWRQFYHKLYVTLSRTQSGIFYYLLSAARLLFYLTLINSFSIKYLYVSILCLFIINLWLNDKWDYSSIRQKFKSSAYGTCFCYIPSLQIWIFHSRI